MGNIDTRPRHPRTSVRLGPSQPPDGPDKVHQLELHPDSATRAREVSGRKPDRIASRAVHLRQHGAARGVHPRQHLSLEQAGPILHQAANQQRARV